MAVFDGIPEFVAVAETQGFSAAARVLKVSTSHVSRSVADLETRLGVALVARTTRRVRLTVAGQDYYERCREIVDGLEAANEAVAKQEVQLGGTLRVSAAGEFAEMQVVPALLQFAEAHPALKVEIDFNSRIVNFVEEGIDFAIRYGRLADSGLVARKLVDRSLVAAASPAYLAQHGKPKHPDQLKQHACLIAASDIWRFNTADGDMEVRVSGRWRSNSGRSIVRACRASMGIAYMPRASFGDSLNDGSLVPLLKDFSSRGVTTWIVYANRRHLPTRARLAINYLLDHFHHWQE